MKKATTLLALLGLMIYTTGCQETRYGANTAQEATDAGQADAPTPEPDTATEEPLPTDGWYITPPQKVHEGRIQLFGQLIAAEDRFAVVWIENQGQLFVQAAWLNPWSMEISTPITVSGPYDVDSLDLTPNNTLAAWNGRELVIAWAAQESIWLRRLRLDGTFVDEPQQVVAATGTRTNLKGVVALPSGRLGLVWLDDRLDPFTYLPWFANVDTDTDAPLEEHQLLITGETAINAGSVSAGRPDPCLCNDRWQMSLSWHRQDGPGTLDQLKLTTFDQDGLVQEVANVIQRDTIQLAFRGEGIAEAGDAGVHVGGWDVDQGPFVVQMMAPGAPSVVQLPRGDARPVLGASPTWGPGVLVTSGSDLLFYPPNTTVPLSDYAAPLIAARLEGETTGYALTGSAGGFGLLWLQENVLWFAMARPLGP